MSGINRYQKKQKENECPRFRQHNKKGSTDNGDKARRSKQGSSVVTFSSNLSRNVVSSGSSQNPVIIKRTEAVSTKPSQTEPVTEPKNTKVNSTEQQNEELPPLKPAPFKPEPPPATNSLHRLGKKVNEVQSELDKLDLNSTEAGLKLAEEKLAGSPTSKKNFQKSVSKLVDISPEEQLYSSLANISLSSTSFDSRIEGEHNLWIASESRKGRDPEPKLEWFHQPYRGTEVLIHPSKEIHRILLEESYKNSRERLLSTPAETDFDFYDE